MKHLTFALAAGVSLAACADSPVDSGKAAACNAETRLAPSMSFAATPARSRLLESPRTVIVIPVKGVAVTNDAVVAGSDSSGAATWSKTAGVRRLTGLTAVSDYNAAGQAAGINPAKLARRDADGTVEEFAAATAGGDWAYGINSEGWVVGQQASRAYFWTPCFGLKHLGQPESDPREASVRSWALDINTRGDIAGSIAVQSNKSPTLDMRATIWLAWSDERVALGPLSHNGSEATAINDKGSVAGTQGNFLSRGPPERFPFFWSAAGGVVSIPLPRGALWGTANDINNLDEVVGSARDTSNSQLHAWVWRKETGTERLPEMGQASSVALAINDWGDIVGMVGNQPVVWTWPENAHRWR
jgi:hypothetical protein